MLIYSFLISLIWGVLIMVICYYVLRYMWRNQAVKLVRVFLERPAQEDDERVCDESCIPWDNNPKLSLVEADENATLGSLREEIEESPYKNFTAMASRVLHWNLSNYGVKVFLLECETLVVTPNLAFMREGVYIRQANGTVIHVPMKDGRYELNGVYVGERLELTIYRRLLGIIRTLQEYDGRSGATIKARCNAIADELNRSALLHGNN